MKELMIFVLKDCPHCTKALKLLEQEDLTGIKVRIVDEVKEAAFANTFCYYYVPSFYCDGEKLHEGAVDEKTFKKIMAKIKEE